MNRISPETQGKEACAAGGGDALADVAQALLLGAIVFISRYLTRAPLYYVDGPILVRCIQDRTFVIQPPGYWLFAHLGGLFRDPASGLQFWNQLFSGLGVAVFFLTCRRLCLSCKMTWIASVAYGSIFFVWLAGDVHSSYASQILFAPLTLYCFLCYRDKPTLFRLMVCGVSYSVGAGLRPSDGAFLAPLFLLLMARYVSGWRSRLILLTTAGVGCLAWYIPTQIAAHSAHTVSLGYQVGFARDASPLLAGINLRSIANTLRVAFPFLAAFWMLLPAIALGRTRDQNRLILFWITPGLAFMLLVFMADPVYFTFLTAAMILMVALSSQQRIALCLLFVCAVFNIGLFFLARPILGNNYVGKALDFYVIKYSYYGVRHQWSSTIGRGGTIP